MCVAANCTPAAAAMHSRVSNVSDAACARASPMPPPRADCCVALGWEVRAGWRVPDGVDWRPWLTRSSVLRNDDVWLAVCARARRATRSRTHTCVGHAVACGSAAR